MLLTGAGTVISAWSPASLTGLAATVLPALSRSQGKLWQDTLKTVSAVAASDPVRVATCPFTGIDFVAPSDAARPVLGTDGAGHWWLVFNGVQSCLTTGMGLNQSWAVGLAAQSTAAANGTQIIASTNQYAIAGNYDYFSLADTSGSPSGNRFALQTGAGVSQTGTFSGWHTYGVGYNGLAASYAADNGVPVTSTVIPVSTNDTLSLGALMRSGQPSGVVFCPANVAGCVAARAWPGTSDWANLTTYLAALHP